MHRTRLAYQSKSSVIWHCALALACWQFLYPAQGASAEKGSTQFGVVLLHDPAFQLGLRVWDPKPGKHVARGFLRPNPATSASEPVWGLAQWNSKFSLAGSQPTRLASGGIRFSNEAKAVTFGPPGSVDADLLLAINSGREYGKRLRQPGEPWPHLLISQNIENGPLLVKLTQLHFHLEYRVRCAQLFRKETAKPNLHAAQLLAFLTVQNCNQQSKGYGDYLWVGIPLYDSRNREAKTYAAMDSGTGKFIYTPAATNYTTVSAHTGCWVTIDRDLLPLILDGLKTAWGRNFLKGSQDLNDFCIGGFNLGWELPGSFDAEAQIRGLALEAK